MTVEQYLEASGQDEAELAAELERQAASQVRVDLALRALAEAEGITVDDEDLVAEIERLASPDRTRTRAASRRRLAGTGGLEQLRSDVRNEKAVAWLTDSVDLVDEQGAPMDRTLLLEATGSEEESAVVAESDVESTDVVDSDEESADVVVSRAAVAAADDETADERAVESAPSKEG